MSTEGALVTITIHPVWWDIWRTINIIFAIVLLTLQIRRLTRRKKPMQVWEVDHQMSGGLWLFLSIAGALQALNDDQGFTVTIPLATLALLFTARVMRMNPHHMEGMDNGRKA